MLILSRRIGEVVFIGDDVQVKVLAAKGAQVRLGIDAPKSVSVDRQEVYERRQRTIAPPSGAEEQRAAFEVDP